ncbi:MAG: DUF1858 domain-containing protein [Peptococcaceae bacterium]|nr:DUF1858 domain-containing protein [Peptococcaceae bacterium]
MKQVSAKDSIYKLAFDYPEIVVIMVELGFRDITLPGMLQTVGRVMTLEKGSKVKGVPMSRIKEVLREHGFELVNG